MIPTNENSSMIIDNNIVFFRAQSTMISSRIVILVSILALINPTKCFINPHHASRQHTALAMANPLENIFALLTGGKVGLVKSFAGPYDSTAIRQKINNYVDSNPVLMFSFTTCPFCIKAKEILDAKGAKYTVVELDKQEDGKAIRAEMGDMLGRTSVPAIWIETQFVGGCNDGPMGGVNGLEREGRLDAMLRAAGAI
jgi:glutaredoxin 3